MDAVIINPPADLIAERQRLGLDHHDEVWNGDYHMVPAGSAEHQRTIYRLQRSLEAVVEAASFEMRHEWNVLPADEPGWQDFRIPDLVVCGPDTFSERGAIGAVPLVVEVRSPGDESFEKLPFFERLGVGEVVIIERDTKAIRRWVHDGERLVESAPDRAGGHQLRGLAVRLWTVGGELVVETPDGVARI